MILYVARRALLALAVLGFVSVVVFSFVHLSGDRAVALAGEGATAEQLAEIRRQYGFDRPPAVQYVEWVGRALRGDFGRSQFLKENVAPILASHLPVTLTLGASAMCFALLLSIPLGVVAALKPNTAVDRIALTIAVVGQSLPGFLVAFLLIYGFGVHLRWLPISGNDTWLHLVLPTIALGYYATPELMRLTRAGMLNTLKSDYVRMARIKGLPEYKVILKHALRNALVPVVALAAVQFGFMLGGSVVVETIFSLQGVGYLAWQSIQRADLDVIQAIVLVVAMIYSLLTLLADILNAFLDPRIRLQ